MNNTVNNLTSACTIASMPFMETKYVIKVSSILSGQKIVGCCTSRSEAEKALVNIRLEYGYNFSIWIENFKQEEWLQ